VGQVCRSEVGVPVGSCHLGLTFFGCRLAHLHCVPNVPYCSAVQERVQIARQHPKITTAPPRCTSVNQSCCHALLLGKSRLGHARMLPHPRICLRRPSTCDQLAPRGFDLWQMLGKDTSQWYDHTALRLTIMLFEPAEKGFTGARAASAARL
jgi:hypothetical protein